MFYVDMLVYTYLVALHVCPKKGQWVPLEQISCHLSAGN